MSDFRNLNKQLNHDPYKITNINEMLLKFESFQYSMSLYFKMGYYNIKFSDNMSNLCMIIIPWGKYW